MEEQKYFDIRRVRVSDDPPPITFRHKIDQHLSRQKSIFKLRWEFLDLSLKGVFVYGSIIIVALTSAMLTTRIISAQINKKPTLQKSPTFSQFEVEKTDGAPADTAKSSQPASEPTKPDLSSDEIKAITPPTEKTTTQEINKQSFNIRVLNGNGRAGDASKVKTDLEAKGYKVGAVANANYKYTKTQIYYLSGSQKIADLVANDLGREEEVKEATQDLIGDGYQILVVLGSK